MTSRPRPDAAPSRRAVIAGLPALALAACSAHRASQASAPDTSSPATSAPAASPSGASPPSGATPTPTATAAPTPTAPAPDLVHGPRTHQAVALTFHGAGDPSLTRQVLREARAAGAGLTVLAVGTWLDANPSLATQVLDGGHELGNHTWTHLPMRELSAGRTRTEVERAAALLRRLTGSPGRWFRPSGTPRSTALIRAEAFRAGYLRCLAYDVDPLDYTDPGAQQVERATLAQARAGSIVSLHLGHPGTVQALPAIFDGLSRRGLRAVTVSQLLDGAA